jgi:hypothetical protein
MDLSNIKLPTSMDAMGKVVVGAAVAFVSYTVNEIRTDVKQLMATSNINTTKIENIENRVNNLEQVTIIDRLKKTASNNKKTKEQPQLIFIKKEDDDEKKWIATL